jgi:hypothetical protein
MKLFSIFPVCILVLFLVFIPLAHATTLSVVANRMSVMINQPFRVDVQLDTQGEDANALQGEIVFPAGQFTVQNILDGSSPISFWIQPPTETASGTISFAGIVPDGFEGAASSVVSVWFLPTASGTGTIALADLQLLKNDGQGSPLALTTTSATISVGTMMASTTPTRPVSFITPDPFRPVISQDPNIYNGQYFLAFSTTDQGSGIAYYEVLEVPTSGGTGAEPAWQVATSPYLLRDQTLSSNIYVRAVDHDGNFIVVEVPAEHSPAEQEVAHAQSSLIFVLALLLLIIIVVAWVLLR